MQIALHQRRTMKQQRHFWFPPPPLRLSVISHTSLGAGASGRGRRACSRVGQPPDPQEGLGKDQRSVQRPRPAKPSLLPPPSGGGGGGVGVVGWRAAAPVHAWLDRSLWGRHHHCPHAGAGSARQSSSLLGLSSPGPLCFGTSWRSKDSVCPRLPFRGRLQSKHPWELETQMGGWVKGWMDRWVGGGWTGE